MPKLIKFTVMLLLFFNIFSLGILTASAEGLLPNQSGKCPAGTANCGAYTLNDMVSLVLIISQFILGLVGSLALLAFIAGGLMWLLSGGKSDLVERGKQTIIGAVVGLVIVFTSFMIIQLVYTALGIPDTDKGQWSISNWFIK